MVHTTVATPAVFGTDGLDQTTGVAHEEDWVVEVCVLTPSRGVTHLVREGERRGGKTGRRGGSDGAEMERGREVKAYIPM